MSFCSMQTRQRGLKRQERRGEAARKERLTIFVGHSVDFQSGTCEVVVQGKKAFKLRPPSSRLLPANTPAVQNSLFIAITTTMPTELPYAADAEMSLDYDELEVRSSSPVARDTPQADLPAAHRFCGYNTRRNSRRTTSLRRRSLTTPGG